MQLEQIHPIRALLFDLDGTLIDSCPGINASLSAAFRAAGRTMPTADLSRVVGPPIRVIASRIDPNLSDAELAEIETTYRAEYDTEGWRECVPYEGVTQALQEMHSVGARMFVVTNKPRIPASKILAYLGMGGFFEELVTRDSRTPVYSSKSEMLCDLLLRHCLPPESTIMVGDTVEDEEAAAANGLGFVYVTYGYGSIDAPHCPITCFSELWTALLKKNLGRRV